MVDDLDDVVEEFLIESHENLDQLERDLVALEESEGDPEIIPRIFRTLHTVKGTCGFLGYSKLESLAHAGESLLSLLRNGDLRPTSQITGTLFAALDAIREMLSSVESTGSDGEGDYSALEQALEACRRSASDAVQVARSGDVEEARGTGDLNTDTLGPASSAGPVEASSAVEQGLQANGGEAVPIDVSASPRGTASAVEASVRVHVDVLDRLMNLVGELVLARNQIVRLADGSADTTLVAAIQRLNQVTTELQEGVMTTRMQPIGNVWSKLPRVVRDLARTCRKRVRVQMEGKETGLDKTLIEAIKDPLTHLVRNAVDHGIEPPEVRQKAGKDPSGLLSLRAYHEGGQVNIEIADDGGGIDPTRLLARALEKGLVTPEQGARLGERQMLNLIFLPGFSTAARVTNLSGRGVGMDVVKTNVERIGGTVEITSRLGIGTIFKVKIPLTLAIVPALIVRCLGTRYAIPQVNLLELARLEPDQDSISEIRGASVYHLRGRLLPLLYLEEELGVGVRPARGSGGVRHVVVLQADMQRFGIVVDEVHDTEEIVVKPLGPQVKSCGAFAGATIMGDGQVALILDVPGLGQRGRIGAQRNEREALEVVAALPEQDDEPEALLMVGVENRHWAVPLSRVTRLEEIETAQTEWVGSQLVAQYRGGILPLVSFGAQLAGEEGTDAFASAVLQVIVFDCQGQPLGMVVDRIHDIVSEHVRLSHVGKNGGVIGSAIVQGKVVEMIDLDTIAKQCKGLEGRMGSVA